MDVSKIAIAFALFTLFVGVAIVSILGSKRKVVELRARGIYPQVGMARDEDVLRLLQAGEKIIAIRCYRELHRVGLKEAKDAVETLEGKNA